MPTGERADADHRRGGCALRLIAVSDDVGFGGSPSIIAGVRPNDITFAPFQATTEPGGLECRTREKWGVCGDDAVGSGGCRPGA